MTTSVTNTYITPSDGWVEIAAAAAKFLRVSGYPHTHPYYLYFGASAPALASVQGTGTATFSGGVPTNGQDIIIGPETYTFKTTASAPFDVQIHAATPGVGTVTFAGGAPTASQTVVIGSETYTFQTIASAPFDVTIGVDAATTAANFVTSVTANSTLITASAIGGVVTVTSILNTIAGNYAYSTSATNVSVAGTALVGGQDGSLVTATNFTSVVNINSTIVTGVDTAGAVVLTSTVSGSIGNYVFTKTASHVAITGSGLFTGGVDYTTGVLCCHKPFWVNITTDEPLWARTPNSTANATNPRGALRLDVAAIF